MAAAAETEAGRCQLVQLAYAVVVAAAVVVSQPDVGGPYQESVDPGSEACQAV